MLKKLCVRTPFVLCALCVLCVLCLITSCNKKTERSASVEWTDSAGRLVQIPANIERIAPSGGLAQIVLYTLCPDKILGLPSRFNEAQKKYFPAKYHNLPVFGQFYGTSDLNMEALIAAKPDIIIDVGEAKSTIKEDLDNIQKQTGIPVIFVEAVLETMPSAYRTLGSLTDSKENAEVLAAYIERTLSEAKIKRAAIPDAKKLRVYYGGGKGGRTVNVAGSIHADVLEYAGAINVADTGKVDGRGMADVSAETVLLWNPDVVLFTVDSIYNTVANDSGWQGIKAIKTGRYYEVPSEPYNWLGRPPSVHRVLGIKWLGNLLYPDVWDSDIIADTKEFFELFYHCAISTDDVKALLAKSTFKGRL